MASVFVGKGGFAKKQLLSDGEGTVTSKVTESPSLQKIHPRLPHVPSPVRTCHATVKSNLVKFFAIMLF